MRRPVWIDRAGRHGAVVVDLEAVAAAGLVPDAAGRLTIPLDILGVIGLCREAYDCHVGITLALAYPPGPRPPE